MQYNLPADPKTATNRVCKVRDIVSSQHSHNIRWERILWHFSGIFFALYSRRRFRRL